MVDEDYQGFDAFEVARQMMINAIIQGDLRTIEELSQNGFDLEEPIDTLYTPLQFAAMHAPDVQPLLCLLKYGANLGAKTKCGRNVVHLVVRIARIDMLYQLAMPLQSNNLLHLLHERSGGGRTPLMDAIDSGEPSAIEYCLEAGMNGQDEDYLGVSCSQLVEMKSESSQLGA